MLCYAEGLSPILHHIYIMLRTQPTSTEHSEGTNASAQMPVAQYVRQPTSTEHAEGTNASSSASTSQDSEGQYPENPHPLEKVPL